MFRVLGAPTGDLLWASDSSPLRPGLPNLVCDSVLFLPRPPNVPLLRAFRSLFGGIWGVSKASGGLAVVVAIQGF